MGFGIKYAKRTSEKSLSHESRYQTEQFSYNEKDFHSYDGKRIQPPV